MFGFLLTAGQAETLATLTKAMGTGSIDGVMNPRQEGPIVFTFDEVEYLILKNGEVLSGDLEEALKAA